jgi:META domain
MKTLLTFFIIGVIASCSKDKIGTENMSDSKTKALLVGKWKAVSLFLSDASTGVCHQEKTGRDITFEFKNELAADKISYTFNGTAPVNSYFGNISFISFDENTNTAKIKVNTIGGTKMAGSPEMMACEQNYYTMLSESTGFQLFADDPNRLIIGKLRDENSHPRDGGTYYVFEKIN